ncbi:unnamed protein product [Amoebophrya sp. A120]|nr:unnamed protein product [Amoebophrya sp. A120]|eukprot:GSA120T00012786001.1
MIVMKATSLNAVEPCTIDQTLTVKVPIVMLDIDGNSESDNFRQNYIDTTRTIGIDRRKT